MKKLLLVLSLLPSFVYANDFLCSDVKEVGPEFNFRVEVQADNSVFFTINEEDTAEVDEFYAPRNPKYKTWKKLAGYYPTIGDGIDGFGVTIIVNKYLSDASLVNTSEFGMLDYRASGPEGYYSVRYKCALQ